MTCQPYNFTQRLTLGEWVVLLDPVAKYGWFEHEDIGTGGGGLWFDKSGDTGMLSEVPEHARNYIDFESYARDCRLGGDVTFVYEQGKVHVFTNN